MDRPPPAKRARVDSAGRLTADADLEPVRAHNNHENKEEKKQTTQVNLLGYLAANQTVKDKRIVAFKRLLSDDPGLRDVHLSRADGEREWYFIRKVKRSSSSPQSAMLSFCHTNMPPMALRVRWHKVKFINGRPPEHTQSFGVFRSIDDYIHIIHRSRDNGSSRIAPQTMSFYELIEENTPCALYFDIEKDAFPIQPTSGDHTSVVDAVHYAVRETFVKIGHFPHIEQQLTRRIVACADRKEESGDWKLSLHIHYPDIVFANNHIDMLQFQKLMIREVQVPPWDMAVYTKNRTLRTIYSNKNGNTDSTLLPLALGPDKMWHCTSVDSPTDAGCVRESIIRRLPADVNVPSALLVTAVHVAPPPTAAAADNHDGDGLNQVERQFVLSVFRAFLALRVTAFQVAARFPDNPALRVHETKPTKLYMTVPDDKFCEHKGRPHTNSNNTQQGYALDFCKQTVHQTCFACADVHPILYSFAPGQRRPLIRVTNAPIHLWQSMQDGEYTMRDLFVREYGFKLKSTPSAMFTKETDTLWAFDNDRRVWSRELSAKLCDWLHQWIRDKVQLVLANDPPPVAEHDDWLKSMAKYKNSPAIRSLRNCIPCAVISHDFEELLHSQHHLIPTDDGKVIDVSKGGVSRVRVIGDLFSDFMPFHMLPDDHPDMVEVAAFMLEYADQSKDLYEDLHRQLGYAMTGWTFDRKFYFWLGNGANAKGTVSAALAQVMGGFFAQSSQAFMSKRGNANMSSEQASPALAGMRFKRVVMLSETPKDCELDSAQLKGLVSGDPQTCRELYKQAMTYTPQFKVVIQTNFVPTTLDVTDQALLDRFNMTPFLARYTTQPHGKELKKDPTRRDRFLALKDAFGTWCVKGAVKAAADGYLSLKVSAYGKELQNQELEKLDMTAIFIRGHAEFGAATYKWSTDSMYEVFRAWCSRRNHKCYVDINAFEAEVISKTQNDRVTLQNDVFVGMRQIFRGVNEAPVAHAPAADNGKDEKDEEEEEEDDEPSSFSQTCKRCNTCKETVIFGYCQECRRSLSDD